MRYVCFQESPTEQVILWDIHRTFPGHDYFRSSEGEGQENLHKICRVITIIITSIIILRYNTLHGVIWLVLDWLVSCTMQVHILIVKTNVV